MPAAPRERSAAQPPAQGAGAQRGADLDALLELAPDAMLLVLPDGTVAALNRRAEAMFGWSAAELRGQPVEVLVPEALRGAHAEHRERYREHPRTRAMGAGFLLHAQRRDGSTFPVEISLHPADTPQGPMVATAVRDVSARRRIEDELRAAASYLLMLQRATVAANDAPTPREALKRVLDEVCAATGLPVGHAFLAPEGNGPGGQLRSAGTWHLDDPAARAPFVEATAALRLDERSLPGRVVAGRGPVWMADLPRHPDFARRAAAAAAGLGCGIAVPALVGPEVGAVLEFFAEDPGPPDRRLLDVLALVGVQVGRAIERARAAEVTRRSELLFAQHPVGIATIRGDGRTLERVNPAFAALLGTGGEALAGTDFLDLVAPRDKARVAALLEAQPAGRVVFEASLRGPGGQLVPVQADLTRVADEVAGASAGWLAVEDLTPRRRAELERARLAAIVEGSEDAIVGLALDGTVTSWNPGAERLFGFPAAERIGRSVGDLSPQGHHDPVLERLARLAAGEAVAPFEAQRRSKDGRLVEVQVTMSPVRSLGGVVVGASLIEHDITPRKQAQRALQESEARFRKVFDEGPAGIVLVGPDLRIQRANRSFCAMLGYGPGELAGVPFAAITHPEDVAEDVELAGKLFRGELPSYTLVKRYLGRDGHVVWTKLTAAVLRDEDGHLRLGIGFVEDITERRRAEQELMEAQQREMDRLREVARFKSQLINTASHELNTPLTAVRLWVDLLHSSALGGMAPRQRRAVEILDQSVSGLANILEDMLDAGRLEAGRLALRTEDLDLAELAREAAEMYGEVARRKGLRLEVRTPASLPVHGDRWRLRQVLANLLSNAVKFTPTGGSVAMDASAADGEAVVRVADTGRGLDAGQLARLFQPFGQVHRAQEDREEGLRGTGLGLYISRGIVEQHGGRIWAESAGPGLGSTFAFALPPEGPRRERAGTPGEGAGEAPGEGPGDGGGAGAGDEAGRGFRG